jgi:hypothetical protein
VSKLPVAKPPFHQDRLVAQRFFAGVADPALRSEYALLGKRSPAATAVYLINTARVRIPLRAQEMCAARSSGQIAHGVWRGPSRAGAIGRRKAMESVAAGATTFDPWFTGGACLADRAESLHGRWLKQQRRVPGMPLRVMYE